MHSRLVTTKEYVASAILRYPLLYAYEDTKLAKFAILDQLLNVIGNGIRDEEELRAELFVKKGFKVDIDRAKAFCEKGVFEGYTQMTEFGPDFDSVTIGYLEEEKNSRPDVLRWNKCNPSLQEGELRVPYPNFKENYSTVYTTNFIKVVDLDWIKETIWFYEKCLEFITSKDSNQYAYAYPNAEFFRSDQLLNTLTKKFIEDYKGDIAKFSKDYVTKGVDFDGDINKFLISRWDAEKKRIIEFINNTLNMLKSV